MFTCILKFVQSEKIMWHLTWNFIFVDVSIATLHSNSAFKGSIQTTSLFPVC